MLLTQGRLCEGTAGRHAGAWTLRAEVDPWWVAAEGAAHGNEDADDSVELASWPAFVTDGAICVKLDGQRRVSAASQTPWGLTPSATTLPLRLLEQIVQHALGKRVLAGVCMARLAGMPSPCFGGTHTGGNQSMPC